MTNASSTLTLYAVTCPQDPHEERPAHRLATSEEEAVTWYADQYRRGRPDGVEAVEVDLWDLADAASAAGDERQAVDCRRAREGDIAALTRVCRALG
jgi:hypothetical protein